jgi:hypothetical protein
MENALICRGGEGGPITRSHSSNAIFTAGLDPGALDFGAV